MFHILNLLRRRQGNVHDKIVENVYYEKAHWSIYIETFHTHIPTKKKTTIKNDSNDRLKKWQIVIWVKILKWNTNEIHERNT